MSSSWSQMPCATIMPSSRCSKSITSATSRAPAWQGEERLIAAEVLNAPEGQSHSRLVYDLVHICTPWPQDLEHGLKLQDITLSREGAAQHS